MSETPTIAKLSAKVSTGNGVENIVINLAVNTAPSATLQLGKKSEQVIVKPLTSEVLAEIRQYQQKRLDGVSSPDVTLEVDDAIYGKFSMSGFSAAPMLEISTANIGFQMALLDKVSMLDGLDLSIYKRSVDMMRQAEIPDSIPISKDGNVTKLLLDLTNMLVANYGLALSKEKDPVRKQIIQMRHELNTSQNGPLEIWRTILQNSNVVHESWGAMIGLHANSGKHISKQTLDMLCTHSSGFWNVLNRLMAAFQMFYKPDPAGNYGKLVGNKEKIDVVSGNLELDIVNLNVRDGSTRILQVGAVTMESGSAPGLRSAEIAGSNTPATAGVYPDPIKKGYIHQEMPPIWLIDAHGAPVLGSKVDGKKDVEPGSEAPNYSQSEYKSRRAGSQEHLRKFEKTRSDVIKEMCESMFKELQLSDSVMSAQLPLNVTIPIGERKKIQLGDAGSVEGFVSSISHHIDLRQGRELDSFSRVTITHVKY